MTRNIRSSLSSVAALLCAAAAFVAGPSAAAAQQIPASLQPDAAMQRATAAPLAVASSMQAVGVKSAGTATLFSLLITGGGQFYNEETTKGVVMLTTSIGFAALAIGGVDEYGCDPDEVCAPWMLPVGLGGALAVKIWSIVDAASGAKRWNASHQLASVSLKPSVSVKPFGDNKSLRLGVKGTF